MFSLREDLCVAVMVNRSADELDWKQSYVAIDLFQTVEERLADGTDKSEWENYCGKYEKNEEDFPLEEVFMKEGKLYARVAADDGEETYQLYPIGDRAFGRKGGFVRITFGENSLSIDGIACKKL
jgi:hypothetical protein